MSEELSYLNHQLANAYVSTSSSDDFVQISREDLPPSSQQRLQQIQALQERQSSPTLIKCSYEDDLWDQLGLITANHKKGFALLSGLTTFCKSYTKQLTNFTLGLQKASDQFEKDMLQMGGFDTTTIAITNIKHGMDELIRSIQDKVNQVIGDIVEPLDLYQKHYQQTFNEQMTQAKVYMQNLEEARKKLLLQQDRYYRLMNDSEQSEINIEQALLEHERGQISLEQVQRITNQTLNIKYKAELASQDYKKEVDNVNSMLTMFDDDYKPLLQRLQQSEESRINFLKYNFEKYLRHLSTIGRVFGDKSLELGSSVQGVNSETDIKIFIDENRTNSRFTPKVEYKAYEYSKDMQKQKSELISKINQQKITNNIREMEEELKKQQIEEGRLLQYLNSLMRGQDIPFEAKSEIISSLHNTQTRETVAEFLKCINSPKVIENAEALKTLGELLKYMLTAYVHDKDENYKVVYAILHSSQQIFHLSSNQINSDRQKLFLTYYLNDHGVWQEQEIWRICITKIINQKFHEAVQSPGVLNAKNPPKRVQQEPQPSPSNSSGGGLFGQLGKIKQFWGSSAKEEQQVQQQNQKQTIRIPKTLAQNIIFNSLSKFLYHFVNFQVPFDMAKEILLHFCNKFELDQNRTHLLLSELESIQKKSRFDLGEIEKREIQLLKRDKKQKLFSNDRHLIIALTIKYLNDDKALRNYLVLSRQLKPIIQKSVYKQALIFSQKENLIQKRVGIWENLLKLKENQSDYEALRSKVLSHNHMIQNVEEVINMDVQRSFTRNKEIDPIILTNILKTYAFFNPEIEYCQGMNFIAGFLFLVFKHEEKAFKALQHVVGKHDMAELFNQELPKLKLFFYQFDRLVSIYLPQLHSHFKDEMINSSYYSSAWFITIFTNSLQNQEGDLLCPKLLELWDYFLTSGWKSIFKIGIYFLKENESALLQMNFEQILNFITEKPKQMLSEPNTPSPDSLLLYHEIHQSIKDIKYLDYILDRLDKEFKQSLEAAQQVKKQQQQQSPNKLQRGEEEEQKV